MTDHGTFSVWAPSRSRVRLVVEGDGGGVVDMRRGIDGWWSPLELPPRAPSPTPTTASCSTTTPTPTPTRVLAANRAACTSCSRTYDASSFEWTRPGLDRAAAGRLGDLRAPHRHVHARRHPRLGDRAARPPSLDRRRPGRADAGQRLQRHPQLGLRRGRLVRGHRAVRRPTGLPALRRRLPRRRPGRRAGRRLQPPRPVGELPAAVRAVPQAGPQHLGRPGQPRRRGLGRGPPLHPRQRSGCGSRTTTSTRSGSTPCTRWSTRTGAHPRGAGDRDAGAVGPSRAAADADRRVRPQRRRAWSHRARPAVTASTPSGATTSTTRCTSR